jgi:hypothetical protein
MRSHTKYEPIALEPHSNNNRMSSYTIYYAKDVAPDDWDSLLDTISTLIERWVENEIKFVGIATFLKEHGSDFDDLTDENATRELRLSVGKAAIEICTAGGEAVQRAFIRTLHLGEFLKKSFYNVSYEGIPHTDSLLYVIMDILSSWIKGRINAHGTLAFLKTQGHDFGITDDDVNACTDAALMSTIVTAAVKVCKEGGILVQQEFVAALEHVTVVRVN